MKFRVGREALGEAVAWVARALPSRPVVPVLAGLLLEAGDGALTLSCFDYEVSARVRMRRRSTSRGPRWCRAAARRDHPEPARRGRPSSPRTGTWSA